MTAPVNTISADCYLLIAGLLQADGHLNKLINQVMELNMPLVLCRWDSYMNFIIPNLPLKIKISIIEAFMDSDTSIIGVLTMHSNFTA